MILGRGGKDTAAAYAGGGQNTAVRNVEHLRNTAMKSLVLTSHGGRQDTGSDSICRRREGQDTPKVDRDDGGNARFSDTSQERRHRKPRERKKNKRNTDSDSSSGSKSDDSSASEDQMSLKEKRPKVKKVIPLNHLFAKMVGYETYRLNDGSTLYDMPVAK